MIVPGSANPLLMTPSGYNLQRSLRFRSSASAYLRRTFGTPTNNKIYTWSGWVKRGALANGQLMGYYEGNSNVQEYMGFANDNIVWGDYNYAWNFNLISTQVFRDPAAWYHIMFVYDSTQATASNRMKIYVNGSQVTSFSTATYPSQNFNSIINSVQPINIGVKGSGNDYFDGYIAECNFIDGQALTPSSFGQTSSTTGVWQPKKYSGTYGTNGFYLPFTDNSALTSGSNAGLGKDFSGNGNYWNTNNISITSGSTYDSMTDVPTLTSATASNFAVLNPLQSAVAPTSGNLNFDSGAGEACPKATIQLPLSGKWYWETYCSGTGTDNFIGVTLNQTGTTFTGTYRAYRKTGVKDSNGTTSAYGASWASGDTLGVAVDMDTGTITFYKNGTSQGVAFSDLAGTAWTVFFYGYVNGAHQVNFGQRPFAYTPPSGYVALNTFNLPNSTIVKGNQYFSATAYTPPTNGNYTVTNGLNLSTSGGLIWEKRRNGAASSHYLADTVRGLSKTLSSNLTDAEATQTNFFTGTTSTGYTEGSSGYTTSDNVISWSWLAGGTGSSNTNGSITSTVSVNATAGFSIVTYTGTGANATVGHGLGVAPAMIIVKRRTNAGGDWKVYHKSLGAGGAVNLDLTNAYAADSTVWQNTSPTSSVFSIGTNTDVSQNTQNLVAYCFAEIAGFSKFGSYTGNGSADGPFVYCGFRPKFVMFKRTDAVNTWFIYDTSRSPYNADTAALYPNTSAAETTDDPIDYLSNGFKMRGTGNLANTSGGTYIFMAFAENPTKYALAR